MSFAPTVTRPERKGTATRLDDAQVMPSLALAMLTTVTVISMCRVFADWSFLRPMLVVALGVHLVAALLRAARSPLWVALPVMVLGLVWLLGLVYYRDTLSMLLPTGRTIDLMRLDLRLVLDQFSSAVAPVPSAGSFAVMSAGAIGLTVVLSDTFAFRAFGRVEAVVPSGVLFVFTAALGTDRHRIVVAALWVGAALLVVAVLRFAQEGHDITWMGARRATLGAALPAIVVTIVFSAVAAAAVAPRLPGAGQQALIDTRNRGGSVTEVLSPLVDIRARMTKQGNAELFTVQSTNGAHYWRVISLPTFDGSAWSPPEEDLSKMGDRTSEVPHPGARMTQIISIENLGGHLVPAAYHPTRVSPSAVYWAPDSQSLVLPDQNLKPGDQIRVSSVITAPTVAQLRAATTNQADSIYYQLPGGLPDEARQLAVQLTIDAPTAYDKAMALQNFFRTQFTYDLNVQFGNSSDAIEAFLRLRRGFCQQFAGTFAVMARMLGLPARVAVGYTPGDLGSDGLYHVFGRHAHAWPEVWFDGLGWVAFEPTPGRGSPDGVAYTGVAAGQDDSKGVGGPVGTGGGPTVTTVFNPNTPTTLRNIDGNGGPGTGNGSTTTTIVHAVSSGSSGSSAVPIALLGLLIAFVLWLLLAPRVVAAWSRRGQQTARERVISAWHRACYALSSAGAPPVGASTPLEYAATPSLEGWVDHHALNELAVQVTRAVYSPNDLDTSVAAHCEALEVEVDSMCRAVTPFAQRVRAAIDPRLMRRRLAG